jgi:hypothetical protein
MQISLAEVGANWFDIDADQEKEIRDIANRDNPVSQRAKAILSLIYNEYYPFEWTRPEENKERISSIAEEYSLCRIYPNPAVNELTIELSGSETDEWELHLIDFFGRTIYIIPDLKIGAVSLNLNAYGSGIYYLQAIKNASLSETHKVQIQKSN